MISLIEFGGDVVRADAIIGIEVKEHEDEEEWVVTLYLTGGSTIEGAFEDEDGAREYQIDLIKKWKAWTETSNAN